MILLYTVLNQVNKSVKVRTSLTFVWIISRKTHSRAFWDMNTVLFIGYLGKATDQTPATLPGNFHHVHLPLCILYMVQYKVEAKY